MNKQGHTLKQALNQGYATLIICEAGESPLSNIARRISNSHLQLHGFYSCTIGDNKTLLITPKLAAKHIKNNSEET